MHDDEVHNPLGIFECTEPLGRADLVPVNR